MSRTKCNKALHQNLKKAWEDELAWEMTRNINKIFNDKHASKQHKKAKRILALNLNHLIST
jgi:hypothetical protein